MTNLRDILANNLKEYRRKLRISQAKLAEKAEISTQYIAMIELSRQFPTSEVLDKIAASLGIEAYQLFAVSLFPETDAENKTANLRDILANNLKEYRRKLRVSQAKLAEKAEISTQYIAMIELSRQFPTPEVMDRIAAALGIEAYQLFAVSPSPETAMERLHDTLVGNLERVVAEAVKQAIAKTSKDNPNGSNGPQIV